MNYILLHTRITRTLYQMFCFPVDYVLYSVSIYKLNHHEVICFKFMNTIIELLTLFGDCLTIKPIHTNANVRPHLQLVIVDPIN